MTPLIAERLHERQYDSSSGLASGERNLAGIQIDRAPREFCQVAEPLSEIQAEKHEPAPFGIIATRFQDPLDFLERERAPFDSALFEKLDARRRIDRDQSLARRLHRDRFAALSHPGLPSSARVLSLHDHEIVQRRSVAASKGRACFSLPRKSVNRSTRVCNASCVDSSVFDCFGLVHVSHHALIEALGITFGIPQ